eukprot:366412-Chlamydomonas_euryale.AAC.10
MRGRYACDLSWPPRCGCVKIVSNGFSPLALSRHVNVRVVGSRWGWHRRRPPICTVGRLIPVGMDFTGSVHPQLRPQTGYGRTVR